MSAVFRLAALALLAASGAAHAVEYATVLPDKSEIRFVSKQMNVPVEGRFRKFDAQLSFDPAKPEAGSTRITLDLAGIDAGSDDANAEVRTKGWFDIRNFPTATFVSTSVKPLGPNRYEVAGKLSIKGRSRDVTAPVSFRQDGANAVLEGSFVVKRLQFAIGEGAWSDVDTVADDVQVRFRMTAAPAK
ncbi:MAG TPA: YceI family protein [Burkholderiales bacterium]|nr:YceI family protein [Burkholderiales bacterium]